MPMSVVQVRPVRVGVDDGLVAVPVAVARRRGDSRVLMVVVVVVVVAMGVDVIHGPVGVLVPMLCDEQ